MSGNSPRSPGSASARDALIRQHVGRLLDQPGIGGEDLISVLEQIQDAHGYLPECALRLVAERLNVPLVDVFGVATFYRAFSLTPRGKHLIAVCLGTACHVNRSPAVVAEFERQLNIQAGQTTADGEFTLETVNCLGACALGPVVFLDGQCHSKVDVAHVGRILKRSRAAPADPEALQIAAK